MELTDLLLERLTGRKCRRCGRRLTDPDSIDEGIGPVCKKLDNHEYVVGWAELRMPRGLSGQGDAKRIAEIGFEHFSNWEIVEMMKVIQANGEWYAFARMAFKRPFDEPLKLVGMSSVGPMAELLEEKLPDGTIVKYECVHQDSEWVSMEYNYEGPSEALHSPSFDDDEDADDLDNGWEQL